MIEVPVFPCTTYFTEESINDLTTLPELEIVRMCNDGDVISIDLKNNRMLYFTRLDGVWA